MKSEAKEELGLRVLKARTRILNAVHKVSPGQYISYFREKYPEADIMRVRNVMNLVTHDLDYTIMAESVADLVEKRFVKPSTSE
jgi:hypothetical protein